ncbi:MAG: hypothetical protein ACR2M1_17595, partial [Gemmatimonadaceae bacterium]
HHRMCGSDNKESLTSPVVIDPERNVRPVVVVNLKRELVERHRRLARRANPVRRAGKNQRGSS